MANKLDLIRNRVAFLLLLFFFGCSAEAESKEKIIAKVGDKTISLNEFIRRAEYTIRPNYCRNNTNIDKKIILNSLIAEKMLSLEVGEESDILKKATVKNFLLGRKEQAMRQFLYDKEVTKKVKLDENLINKVSNNVTRQYDISYISLADTLVVTQLKEELIDFNLGWDSTLHDNYNLKDIPKRVVTWNGLENFKLLDLLFTQDVQKGSIYGPLKFSDEHYMFLKINGWTATKEINESQKLENIKNIEDVYRRRESRVKYEDFIRKVMEDHSIEFNSEIFFNLADIMGPIYMKSQTEKEEIFKKGVWAFDKEQNKYKNLKPDIEQIKKKILYKLDDKSYTVSQFLEDIQIHPLVFRQKQFQQKEFGFQLQMAIIDQVRDKYLTKIAYENNFDQSPEVVRDNSIWSDYLNSVFHKYKYLEIHNADNLFAVDNQTAINEVLNPYINKLQKKYSDKIYINTDLFNSIKLSNIDMSVIYSGAPFSLVVPSFPLITSEHKLDYGEVDNNLN
ncbi:MAG: hypothetical protein KKF62_06145 [Bacteroidetes bacterium]|nr:hypothetical protein [Bacteroidota bacterium]MBU1113587.1 hypothetical protein [Bacteroidota bacterium]MBU1796963.1 hypothetical protein [Bacteroidota bacterium]